MEKEHKKKELNLITIRIQCWRCITKGPLRLVVENWWYSKNCLLTFIYSNPTPLNWRLKTWWYCCFVGTFWFLLSFRNCHNLFATIEFRSRCLQFKLYRRGGSECIVAICKYIINILPLIGKKKSRSWGSEKWWQNEKESERQRY